MSNCKESTHAVMAVSLFVSSQGNDQNDGRHEHAVSPQECKGPYKTVHAALRTARALQKEGKEVRIVLRDGRHELKKPLILKPSDSGHSLEFNPWHSVQQPARPLTFCAYPGESPVLSGGRRITNWKVTEHKGRTAWVATLPPAFRGKCMKALWVDGLRAKRTRWPREGLLQMDGKPHGDFLFTGDALLDLFTGQQAFTYIRGELPPNAESLRNIEDIEFVALHMWIESRIPLKSIDAENRIIELAYASQMRLSDDGQERGAPYYLENVFEALEEPGQWYLDRAASQVYYLPTPEQEAKGPEQTEIIAPLLPELVRLQGNPETEKPVHDILFDGITFSYTEPGDYPDPKEELPQAAAHVPAAITFHHTRDCCLRNCTLEHLGSYALEITAGSRDVRIERNTLRDMAAGGIKVMHTPLQKFIQNGRLVYKDKQKDQRPPQTQCRRITLSDNEISDGGHLWRQSVGILVGKCSGIEILHNHIHHFDYTGISVGWVWGYSESESCGNVIEYNHVHDIGRRILSDLGGIYLLGVQPGTRIRRNIIHDVYARGYGGCGLYLDEGSSHILVEQNLIYNSNACMNLHYGMHNTIAHNIFAFAKGPLLSHERVQPAPTYTLWQNIFWGGEALMHAPAENTGFEGNLNLYGVQDGREPVFGHQDTKETLAQWQKRGTDADSILADPMFMNPEKGDFRLKKSSPALKMGFMPWDHTQAGPRSSGRLD